MKEILILDNHDSFVYNLVEILRRHCSLPWRICKPEDINGLSVLNYAGILLSPGPGLPQEVAPMMQLIAQVASGSPECCPSILGICLGHQALGLYFGARLIHLPRPKHGHSSALRLCGAANPILKGIEEGSFVGRYHSWALDPDLPKEFIASGFAADDDTLMAMHHRYLPFFGLQFHPESIITEAGERYITNWLETINRG